MTCPVKRSERADNEGGRRAEVRTKRFKDDKSVYPTLSVLKGADVITSLMWHIMVGKLLSDRIGRT